MPQERFRLPYFYFISAILLCPLFVSACTPLTSFLFPDNNKQGSGAQIAVVSRATDESSSSSPVRGSANAQETAESRQQPIVLASSSQARQLVSVPTRDLRDLALRLRPGVDHIPLIAPGPISSVGDRTAFWVSNVDDNEHFQIEAELLYKNDVVYIWAEENHKLDVDEMAKSADRFAQGIYPSVRAFFGKEPNPGIDDDPRLHILHATRLGRGIAGYFSSADAFNALANPFSNQKEMFTISLDWLRRLRDLEVYETVLAHEFQHMVHWNNDRNEETWVNEGMSELAQEVAGYPPDTGFARIYMNNPDTQLNTWNLNPNDTGRHYGAAYLYMVYFLQRFGEEMTKAVVSQPANGTHGFDVALRQAGLNLSFEDVFADWIVANYVPDFDALEEQGIVGYSQVHSLQPEVEEIIKDLSQKTLSGSVSNFGVDYIAFQGRGDASVIFRGDTITRFANVGHNDLHAWWSNRSDDSDVRLTREFDFTDLGPGEELTMTVDMWYDIEEDYDYGYLLASRDGKKWDIISGQRTTTHNPSGNSFGHAFTGQSEDSPGGAAPEWVQETFNLGDYAGEKVFVRFEYVTDDAVNAPGWFIEQIEIPAIDYTSSWEEDSDNWESEGWRLTNNRLPQEWLVQFMVFQDGKLTHFERPPVGKDGTVRIEMKGLDKRSEVVLAISGLTPVTTEEAQYELSIEQLLNP